MKDYYEYVIRKDLMNIHSYVYMFIYAFIYMFIFLFYVMFSILRFRFRPSMPILYSILICLVIPFKKISSLLHYVILSLALKCNTLISSNSFYPSPSFFLFFLFIYNFLSSLFHSVLYYLILS